MHVVIIVIVVIVIMTVIERLRAGVGAASANLPRHLFRDLPVLVVTLAFWLVAAFLVRHPLAVLLRHIVTFLLWHIVTILVALPVADLVGLAPLPLLLDVAALGSLNAFAIILVLNPDL